MSEQQEIESVEGEFQEITETEIDQEVKTEIASVSMAEIEEMAQENGWSPDKGNLSALEFMKNSRNFRDRMSDQIKELRAENATAMNAIGEFITGQKQEKFQEETKSLEDQIRAAADDGDSDKVIELTRQLKNQEAPAQTPDANQVAFESWQADAENAWIMKDPELVAEIQGLISIEIGKDGGRSDANSQLPRVADRLKKLYPDKVPGKATENPNANRASGAAASGKTTKAKTSGLTRSDLTETEAANFDQLIKSGLKEKSLLASIEKQRAM